MEKEILKKQKQLTKEGYVVVPNYFLRERVKVLGVGPAMLYLYLLTYCHKGKDIAWPTISTLSKKMNLTPKTITKYRQILLKYGLIKKVSKRKTSPGGHMRNIYQLTPFDMEKNTLSIGNISTYLEGKFTPDIRENLPTNNNNLNNTNATTTKRKKDAVVAVNFKKLKEKGEEKVLAIKEQLLDLDFKESFIEKLLKDYSSKKIEEKIELLKFKRNIQNPAGWLSAALKNDYQDPNSENSVEESPSFLKMDSRFHGNDIGGSIHQTRQESPGQINPSLTKNKNSVEGDSCLSISKQRTQSREKALKMIKKTREMLANLQTKGGNLCQN